MFTASVRPLILACVIALLAASSAEARVVIIATGVPQAALLDTRANSLAAPVPVPAATRAVAAAPDGSRAYITAGRGIAIIDLATNTVAGGVPLQGLPAALAISSDGSTLYAARHNGIEVVDVRTPRRVGLRTLSGDPVGSAKNRVDLTVGRLRRAR